MTMSGWRSRIHSLDRRHPLWWDVIPATVIAAVSLNVTHDLGPFGVGLSLAVHVAVVFRRRAPLRALLVVFSGVLVANTITMVTGLRPPWMYLAVWLLLYGYGLRERGRSVAVVCGIIGLTAMTALFAPTEGIGFHLDAQIRTSLAVLGMCAASYLLGLQIRSRREQSDAQRAEIARIAAADERSRIAQEMHDIIGHNLSVITSLANGGTTAARVSPEEAVRVFQAIGEVSRSSVRDVRRVLAVLRHDGSAHDGCLNPQPGLDELPALLESVRAAGLYVRLTQTGDLRGLSAGRQLAVYRIVQESLTNAMRHAGTQAQVQIEIVREHDGLSVLVENSGSRLAAAQLPTAGPGQGILGMRERVEAYGGTLRAGPTPTGWRVHARILEDRS